MSEKAINFFAHIVVGTVIAIPIFSLFFLFNLSASKICYSHWQSFEPKYSFWSGCLVKVNGKYLPEDRLKDGAFSLTGVKIDDRRA